MAQPIIQASFNTGEWSPSLNARVDLQKYHSAAALLENFFVDYRGGASTRPGTKYVATCFKSDHPVRLIPFQASFTVGYILEFGDFYIRFYFQGAPVLLSGNPYTLASPYAAADLAKLKFSQNVNQLIICHPSYPPQALTLVSATNWTIAPIAFGSTIASPTGVTVVSTLSPQPAGYTYSYVVTAVDVNGQESPVSNIGSIGGLQDQRTVAGTNHVSWNGVQGATSYNVYKALITQIPAGTAIGAAYGFAGNCTGTSFDDTNIAQDFSQTPPIEQNPFGGSVLSSTNSTSAGTYTTVPSASVVGGGGSGAVVQVACGVVGSGLQAGGEGYSIGQTVSLAAGGGGGTPGSGGTICTILVTGIGFNGAVTTYTVESAGFITSGSLPSVLSDTSGAHLDVAITPTWGVIAVPVLFSGAGYTSTPSISFSSGTAGATAVLAPSTAGNPSAVTFFQQRLVLAAPTNAIQTFYMSQPGSYFNFNISNPIQPDDAITGSIVAGQLNEIQSMVAVPTGLMVLTSQANWLVNGGASNTAITPIDATANAHSYIGASEVPPIVSNFDVLFVQSKGSVVRDLTYNFYAAVFTGTDITVLSSHLFYGHTITEWAWAQEPFHIVWAVRDDGVMLTLTFLKEQEFIGWTHSVTNGLFKSVATVTESVSFGSVDAVYAVVERVINGQTVKYVERVAERIFPNGATDAWCVDAGLQYNGPPTSSFSGAQHLAGATVTGLADGVVIPPFTMPVSGSFTLATPASKVTVGLPFTADLQTLAIDLGEPTVQGKMKVIPSVTIRVENTLGLKIGATFNTLVNMKDLIIGNVGSATNTVVTGLVTGDAMTNIDARYTVPGQYCIRQSLPLPATILGVIPEVAVGDTVK